MIGGIIFLLIIYACLVGAYYIYKREKTDISDCPYDPVCTSPGDGDETYDCKFVYAGLVMDSMNSLVNSSPSFAQSYSENTNGMDPASIEELMDYDTKFDVGGIYSLEKLHEWSVENYPTERTPDEKDAHETWQRNNCISVLKSKTKFKTNWLYFGDGF